MPELPDVAAYIAAIEPRILNQPLDGVRLASPFLLRTTNPPLSEAAGRTVREVRRVGKRIAIGLDGGLWLVLHLMIAGRLHWRPPGAKLARRGNLAAFDFPRGSLTLTEAGTKRRASLHFIAGEEELHALNPGGIDLLTTDPAFFRTALAAENHTLKRALTDPRLVSGIGNAYSDEILHAAGLSPLALTQKLTLEEWERLLRAAQATLRLWINRLCDEALHQFPEKVTAFRECMAVHGRYGEPCPRCGEKVLRIRYADNETNYCARCQTGGKVLADRGLSRLLGKDWPRTLEELESLKRPLKSNYHDYMKACTHTNQIHDVKPHTTKGCEDCLKIGDDWVHLRLCLTCGHVGCCDSSKNKHATKHFHSSGHPIVKSFEPGEDWGWCYIDELELDFA